uniref:Uncharacterized protein n=1 Tax=viral metagenome TaxID=1070528 RepID=A0A6C0DL63_9ZZZZ
MGDVGVSRQALAYVFIPPLIVGYTAITNSKSLYNFYKSIFGVKYMVVGVVLLFVLFGLINGMVCLPRIVKNDIGEDVVVDGVKNELICGRNNEGLSKVKYISFILALIFGYYLYKNKITENKLLALSTVILLFVLYSVTGYR